MSGRAWRKQLCPKPESRFLDRAGDVQVPRIVYVRAAGALAAAREEGICRGSTLRRPPGVQRQLAGELFLQS
jgi:hypothetical protein